MASLYVKFPQIYYPILALLSLYTILLLIFLYLRRHTKVVAQHAPEWLAYTVILGYIIVVQACIVESVYLDEFPCYIFTFCTIMFVPGFLYSYFVRSWKLYFTYNLNIEKDSNYRSHIFYANRYQMSNRYIVRFVVFFHAVNFVISGIIYFIYTKPYGNFYCLNSTVVTVAGFFIFIEVTLLFLSTFVLRKVEDAFSIQKELRLNTVFWSIFGFTFDVVYFSFEQSTSILSAPGIFILLIYLQSTLISVVYVIYLSYTEYWAKSEPGTPISSITTDKYTLDFFIQNSIGTKFLKKFLNLEFSVETLLFLTDVLKFKKDPKKKS